jgi:predicted DNA binding CopG/RHH family protein
MKKNKEVSIRYSTEEYQKVKRKSDKLGMPVSTFIRTISLLVDITPTT